MRKRSFSKSISKEEALSFFLTHIVVTQGREITLNPKTLFDLMSLATEAEDTLRDKAELIPHEVIESLAETFLDKHV